MPYVYVISSHEQDGTKAVRATLDRTMLPAMLRAYRNDDHECHARLATLLDVNDEELAEQKISDGGMGASGYSLAEFERLQLHVIRLSERQHIHHA